MSSPTVPEPSVPSEVPPPTAAASDAETSTGLSPNVAGLLAYLGLIGVVVLLLEKEHREVRFHAAQNTALLIGLFGVYVALTVVGFAIPFVWLIGVPIWLGSIALWLFLLVQGYRLNHVELPVVGAIAMKWSQP